MPVRTICGTDVKYFLVVLDEQGKEREEPDGSLLRQAILRRLAGRPSITDVFLMSHGWMGDVPAAIQQYDA